MDRFRLQDGSSGAGSNARDIHGGSASGYAERACATADLKVTGGFRARRTSFLTPMKVSSEAVTMFQAFWKRKAAMP